MTRHRSAVARSAGVAAAIVVAVTAVAIARAQTDRLRTMPGFDRYVKLQIALAGKPAIVSGALDATWADDSRSLTFERNGRLRRFDVETRRETDAANPAASSVSAPGAHADPCPAVAIPRGGQRVCEGSPTGAMKAYYRDGNLYLSAADGSHETPITTEGHAASRVKYGTASWVYGEELKQDSAIWWSPDGRKIAFYRFDESEVTDYYVTTGETAIQDRVDVEAYPTAGSGNPRADILVYDLASRQTVTLDVRDGRPFTDDVVGYYVYDVRWSPDSTAVWMNRTDRRQHVMELASCRVASTACRAIVRETWRTGWVENHPVFHLLSDGHRFIWGSSRSGWLNYYLYDLDRGLLNPVTRQSSFDASTIVRVNERDGTLFYMARDGDNPLEMQLHRVGLDGRGDARLTDPAFGHTVTLSPDAHYFVDVYETHDTPPRTRLADVTGRVVAELAASDATRMIELHLHPVEMFTYPSADGRTMLRGTIAFPSDFDPMKRYPVLVGVYGGPESDAGIPSERFTLSDPIAEYGFLVVGLSSRAQPGLGRRVLDSIYLALGQTEVDDVAEGVKALAKRPYVDAARVGIFGTSYGGYMAVMEVLRHPDLFAAAVASSPPTDWRNYDTIYTERYMGLPRENEEAYRRGSALTYAGRLGGRLLIYYGTADDNVHPSNSLQLIQALQNAGKSFEVQVGPDEGHSAIDAGRMMEFFVENLLVRPERLFAPGTARPSGDRPERNR